MKLFLRQWSRGTLLASWHKILGLKGELGGRIRVSVQKIPEALNHATLEIDFRFFVEHEA